jgi:hypothetical protein
MDAKHQFKYTYNETSLEDFSPVEVTFEVPGDVNLTQMLYNFQCYLRACGFVFDGSLEIVSDDFYNEPCCGDEDCCGLEETSSSLDNEWTKAEKAIKEWNEGIAKLDNEQKMKAYKEACCMSDTHNEAIKKELKKNKWVHGICNPPSPDWKASNSDNCWNS